MSVHSHRPRLVTRGLVVLSFLLTLVVWSPVVGEAAPPVRASDAGLGVTCEVGELSVNVFAGELDDGSAFLDVVVVSPEAFAFGFTQEATVTETTASGVVELIAEEGPDAGEVVATASVDVALMPSGPTESFSDRFRDGNVLVRFDDEFTPASVDGTIVLDGDLSTPIEPATDCSGQLFSFDFFATNPATFVDRIDERYLDCSFGGDDVAGFLSASADDESTFVDLFLETADGFVFGFDESADFTDEILVASLQLVDEETGQPIGAAEVEASLTSIGGFTDRVQSPRETIRVEVEQFAVDGTVTIGGVAYPLTDCLAEHVEGRVRFTSPPPRGGRPAPNDAPQDAIPLAVPGSATASTSGTADEPEAPCTLVLEDEDGTFEVDLPITNTVWYVIEGTGGLVTIDTAGSDFDTILGVYSTGLEQVACVDDTDTLQAAVTIETIAGETYLVQAGGFAGSVGRLAITTFS